MNAESVQTLVVDESKFRVTEEYYEGISRIEVGKENSIIVLNFDVSFIFKCQLNMLEPGSVSLFTVIKNSAEQKVDENCNDESNSDIINLCDFSFCEGDFYFVCGICRRWFTTTSSLTIHFSGHFNDCPKCDVCDATFTTAEDYSQHCAQHIGHSCMFLSIGLKRVGVTIEAGMKKVLK
ncbi:zinc finger protein 227 [Caerostris darwini]|uniref:Zinc finger protein 227 n=1 Tax=Caerostris darwini TaxID=1538125 RepID=A0AAV4WZY9_9ARAC|nr:zinc finger protein 227 [Caerostris darwini]